MLDKSIHSKYLIIIINNSNQFLENIPKLNIFRAVTSAATSIARYLRRYSFTIGNTSAATILNC